MVVRLFLPRILRGGVSRRSEIRRASYLYSIAVEEFLMSVPCSPYFLTDYFTPRFLVGADCRFEEEVWW
jgi:hypothetical protein